MLTKNTFTGGSRFFVSRLQPPLLLVIVFGSVLGASAACSFLMTHSSGVDLASALSVSRSVRFSRFLLLQAFFSILLFAAGFSQRSLLIYLLFFCKGVLSGYHVWLTGVLLRQGCGSVSLILFLLICVLPLPVCLMTAASFLQRKPTDRLRVFPPFLFLHCAVIGLASILRALLL